MSKRADDLPGSYLPRKAAEAPGLTIFVRQLQSSPVPKDGRYALAHQAGLGRAQRLPASQIHSRGQT